MRSRRREKAVRSLAPSGPGSDGFALNRREVLAGGIGAGARVAFLDDAHQSPDNSHVSAAPGVIVPPEAVVANGDSGVVFVINGNTAEQRTVRLGTRNADGQTILAGLPAGALVAVGDLSKLSDRAKVHIVQ